MPATDSSAFPTPRTTDPVRSGERQGQRERAAQLLAPSTLRRQRLLDARRGDELNGVVVDQSELFMTKLQEWEDFYNFDRPLGALGGQTPYERLRQKEQDHRCQLTSSVAHCGGSGIRTHDAPKDVAVFKCAGSGPDLSR